MHYPSLLNVLLAPLLSTSVLAIQRQAFHHSFQTSDSATLPKTSYDRHSHKFEKWIDDQYIVSTTQLFRNIHPNETAEGCVVASPSKHRPDYWYHWTRDSALVMDVVNGIYERSKKDSDASKALEEKMWNWAAFEASNQQQDGLTGLGEPKFNVDGSPFMGDWGRPQNDGPALRALTLIHFARVFLSRGGDPAAIDQHLYNTSTTLASVVRTDLDYVANEWRKPCFDLWEEVKGTHYYTRSVQRAALAVGARFVAERGDKESANRYELEAKAVQRTLPKHVKQGRIHETLDRVDGINYKYSNLDLGSLLSALHTRRHMTVTTLSDRVLVKTIDELRNAMRDRHFINQKGQTTLHAPAIGRYTEDRYNGYENGQGNPWVLGTAAFAEYYYFRSQETASNPGEAQALLREGDKFLQRVFYHTPQDLSQAEQIDGQKGFHRGAKQLTWSHASLITAIDARRSAMAALGRPSLQLHA
ncbi:Six-hairpin glycosidase-like protein [Phlyctochytrium arcticum]|nr:Six-hairpin glycosidase-like protein [Phlyctochytrium arcticum]